MTYNQESASDYARLRHIHGPLLEAILSGSNLHRGSKVLELGCGTGNYLRAIGSRTGCSAWGIDPSSDMLNQARSRQPEVAWICAPAENPAITDVQFDFVFTVDAVHHFQDRARVFSEVIHLLRNTGTFCIATDSEEIIQNRTPLSIYWPETIELELARYPRISALETELQDAGLVDLHRQEVSTSGWLTDPTPYRNKAFSALRLLPEPIFERGLSHLEAELAKGPVRSTSRSLLLWAKH
jgi:SAM-dependent methyltransferase